MRSKSALALKITLSLFLSIGILSGCASPQRLAATGSSNQILEYLAKPNSDINSVDAVGSTMLHLSTGAQRTDIVKLLLDKSANPNLINKYGHTPLSYAARNGNTDIATLLLTHGANAGLALPINGSALMVAVAENQEKMVDLLLQYKPNLDLPNINAETALMLAVGANQEKIVDLLLQHKPDLNSQNGNGATALIIAIASKKILNRNKNTAEKLINAGADLNKKYRNDESTALFIAIDLEINDVAELLIEKNADPNIPNNSKLYPLHIATQKINAKLVQKLVDKKANLNVKSNFNTTALMYAAMKSSLDISKILVSAGADINAVDDQGATALSYASKEGYTDLVKYLLDKKADPNIGSAENKPLALAKKLNRYEIISILEKSLGIKNLSPNESVGRQGYINDGLKLSATGSGVRVSSTGVVVTNAHVTEGCRDIRVNNTSTPLLATDSVNDLAIIKGTAGANVAIRNANTVRVGETVVVVGFPLSGFLGTGIQANTGDVSALSGISNDSRLFQISAPVNPGNSGGPLFDNRGNLIGIVKSKLSATKMLKATGDIPQNINFAIKSNVLTSFLNVHGVNYKSNSNDRVRNVADIVDSARDTAVAIECWN
jgi:ankyrin repeat protein